MSLYTTLSDGDFIRTLGMFPSPPQIDFSRDYPPRKPGNSTGEILMREMEPDTWYTIADLAQQISRSTSMVRLCLKNELLPENKVVNKRSPKVTNVELLWKKVTTTTATPVPSPTKE